MDKNALPATTVLLLGSNLGDRAGFLTAGMQGLVASCGTIVQCSGIYESAAWGSADQQDYLNVAIVVHTILSPEALLRCCQHIENAHGRERTGKWAARTLDIDILFYDQKIIALPHLKIPHPLLPERRFVLMPLAEIIPGFRHPQKGLSVQELLARCPDDGWVRLWEKATGGEISGNLA